MKKNFFLLDREPGCELRGKIFLSHKVSRAMGGFSFA
jgi:hypothetical protein